MSQVTYNSEKTEKKAVRYTGTDTLREGYLLCYEADFAGADATEGITGDATVRNPLRAIRVEKPAADNIENFAGVVGPGFDGKVGPVNIDILIPTARGQKVNIWSEESTTINATILSLKVGSYAAGSSSEGSRIGKALQTVDRSSTNGVVYSMLEVLAVNTGNVVTATSRTTVQLPTAAIWDNFPLVPYVPSVEV